MHKNLILTNGFLFWYWLCKDTGPNFEQNYVQKQDKLSCNEWPGFWGEKLALKNHSLDKYIL